MWLSHPLQHFIDNPPALALRNRKVLEATEAAAELVREGFMRLGPNDAAWRIEELGGHVRREPTTTTFDWGKNRTIIVYEQWAEREVVLAARTVAVCARIERKA